MYGVSVKVDTATYAIVKRLAKGSGRTIQGQISQMVKWYTMQDK